MPNVSQDKDFFHPKIMLTEIFLAMSKCKFIVAINNKWSVCIVKV